VWQPAHFDAKIGATLPHVGAAAETVARLSPDPAAIVVATIAGTAAVASARASLFRVTVPR
jgi:hypothetical protein